MKNRLSRFIGAGIVMFIAAGTTLAQDRIRPPEEIGLVTAVSPATSTITINGRRLLVTNTTHVIALDSSSGTSPLSPSMKGRHVGFEVGEGSNGQLFLKRIVITPPDSQ